MSSLNVILSWRSIGWTLTISLICLAHTMCKNKLFRDGRFTFSRFYSKTRYYNMDGETYRDVFNVTGIRMVFQTKGKGMIISIRNLVIQLATFLALVRFASIIFDIYALNFAGCKIYIIKGDVNNNNVTI